MLFYAGFFVLITIISIVAVLLIRNRQGTSSSSSSELNEIVFREVFPFLDQRALSFLEASHSIQKMTSSDLDTKTPEFKKEMISSLSLSANEANNILNQITTTGKEHWSNDKKSRGFNVFCFFYFFSLIKRKHVKERNKNTSFVYSILRVHEINFDSLTTNQKNDPKFLEGLKMIDEMYKNNSLEEVKEQFKDEKDNFIKDVWDQIVTGKKDMEFLGSQIIEICSLLSELANLPTPVEEPPLEAAFSKTTQYFNHLNKLAVKLNEVKGDEAVQEHFFTLKMIIHIFVDEKMEVPGEKIFSNLNAALRNPEELEKLKPEQLSFSLFAYGELMKRSD